MEKSIWDRWAANNFDNPGVLLNDAGNILFANHPNRNYGTWVEGFYESGGIWHPFTNTNTSSWDEPYKYKIEKLVDLQ